MDGVNAKTGGRDIAALSMGIQKGTYDGIDEALEKLGIEGTILPEQSEVR